MRTLLQSNKKAVSPLIAYVLLISLALALSVMVYSWLKYYVNAGKEKPSKEIKLIIRNTYCVPSSDSSYGWLEVHLQNKGRFTIDGFIIKANDKEESRVAVYTLNDTGSPIDPGKIIKYKFEFSKNVGGVSPPKKIKKVTFIEVQPFIKEKQKRVLYPSIFQEVSC